MFTIQWNVDGAQGCILSQVLEPHRKQEVEEVAGWFEGYLDEMERPGVAVVFADLSVRATIYVGVQPQMMRRLARSLGKSLKHDDEVARRAQSGQLKMMMWEVGRYVLAAIFDTSADLAYGLMLAAAQGQLPTEIADLDVGDGSNRDDVTAGAKGSLDSAKKMIEAVYG